MYWRTVTFPWQAGVALRLLRRLSEKLETPSVIICGDFNSTPDFPPYEFLQNGFLSEKTIQTLDKRSEEQNQVRLAASNLSNGTYDSDTFIIMSWNFWFFFLGKMLGSSDLVWLWSDLIVRIVHMGLKISEISNDAFANFFTKQCKLLKRPCLED